MSEIQAGDCVKLKSGGPLMTVSGVGAYDTVTCDWFDGTKLKHEVFKQISLKVESKVESKQE